MLRMEYLKKYGVLVLLFVSLTFNLTSYNRLGEANRKINESNRLVSMQVERSIRQSIRFTEELMTNQSQHSMQNLQRTSHDLSSAFGHLVNMNETERSPNIGLGRGLSGIESLRNVIVHHLNNQYIANNNTLSEEDLELLGQVYQNLERLLTVFHNINERLPELKNASNSDGGLGQIASNIEEMTRLYRHSIVPNSHPNYVNLQAATEAANKHFPLLAEKYSLQDNPELQIRDGVHSYQLKYYLNKDLAYTVAIDAINLGLRSYEIHRPSSSKRLNLSRNEALVAAQEFLEEFYQGEVLVEYFEMAEQNSNDIIYSFRFTPIVDQIKVMSDAFIINFSSTTGLVKYSNDFLGTTAPKYTVQHSVEDIIENKLDDSSNIEYEGLSLIKSFQTRYKPRVAYSFITTINEQEMLIFYDVETGKNIYSMYNIYDALE